MVDHWTNPNFYDFYHYFFVYPQALKVLSGSLVSELGRLTEE